VRVKMTELFAIQSWSRAWVNNYSPVVYTIQERRGSRVGIMDYRHHTRLFKADSLQQAGELESGDLSYDRTLKLNGIERSRTDAINL
jgi:hypothetical protein